MVYFEKKTTCRWKIWNSNSKMKYLNKGGFFSESAMRFSDLQISKKNIAKNYPELEIFCFGDLEIWKNFIALSEKKPPLVLSSFLILAKQFSIVLPGKAYRKADNFQGFGGPGLT